MVHVRQLSAEQVDAATNRLAADLRLMKERLQEQGQLSPEEAAEFDRMATYAESLASGDEFDAFNEARGETTAEPWEPLAATPEPSST